MNRSFRTDSLPADGRTVPRAHGLAILTALAFRGHIDAGGAPKDFKLPGAYMKVTVSGMDTCIDCSPACPL